MLLIETQTKNQKPLGRRAFGVHRVSPPGTRAFAYNGRVLRYAILIEESDIIWLVPFICTRATSTDPAGWHKDRAAWGHHDVLALLEQRLFGGTLPQGISRHEMLRRPRVAARYARIVALLKPLIDLPEDFA